MLPRGANKLPLSKMHMGGLGTWMMKGRMAGKNLPNLPGLMEDARKAGIRLVACTMSMEAMGIREEELIDGVELGCCSYYICCCCIDSVYHDCRVYKLLHHVHGC